MPMIIPNSPMAEAKISMIRILTNSAGFAASAKAAPEPTIPGKNDKFVEKLIFLIFTFMSSAYYISYQRKWVLLWGWNMLFF